MCTVSLVKRATCSNCMGAGRLPLSLVCVESGCPVLRRSEKDS